MSISAAGRLAIELSLTGIERPDGVDLGMDRLQYHLADRHATWLELFLDLVFVAGLIASVIGHTIRNDIAISDFRLLAIAGTVLIYLGKQVSYFVVLPPYRINILINSSVCIAVTTASTFAPGPEYALIGITFALIFYSFSNFRWTLTKDVTPYLEEASEKLVV